MRITISEIAKLANVSQSAVSIVLNNKPGVSAKTREKILATIKKYNYRPNHLAQSLAARETKSIGLVIKEIDNPYFAKIVKGVYDTCSKMGYSVLLGSSERSSDKEIEIINTLVSKRVDGLLISPVAIENFSFTTLASLTSENYPMVILEQVKNHPASSVDIDNISAAYEAVSYLIKLGHTRIAYLAGPISSGHGQRRLEGYKNALSDHHIPINKNFIVNVEPFTPSGFNAGMELFEKKKDTPTAVFCYNDLVAIGVMNALEKLKIQVPNDVSVIGFDDIDFGEYLKVPLTTIQNPAYKIGKAGVTLLLKQLAKSSTRVNEKIVLEHKLIERSSCAKCKSKSGK